MYLRIKLPPVKTTAQGLHSFTNSSIREWNSFTDKTPANVYSFSRLVQRSIFFSSLFYFTLTHVVFGDTIIILLLYNPNLNKVPTYLSYQSKITETNKGSIGCSKADFGNPRLKINRGFDLAHYKCLEKANCKQTVKKSLSQNRETKNYFEESSLISN